MTTQGVVTQNTGNLLSSASNQLSAKGNQKSSSFDLFMGKSLQQNTTSATNDRKPVKEADTKTQDMKDINSDAADKLNNSKMDKNVVKETTSDDSKTKETGSQKATDKVTTTSEEDKTSTVNEDQDENAEIASQVTSMVNAIQDVVMQLLNLTQEEFNQLMNNQGMTTSDLLIPQNITKLILANSGSEDITAMLTNENLADTMKQMLQQVDQIKAEAALPFTDEQLKEILQQLNSQVTGNNDDQSKLVANSVLEDGQSLNLGQFDDASGTDQNNMVKDITVEITKLSDTNESNGSSQKETRQNSNDTAMADSYQVFMENLVKSSQNVQTDSNFMNSKVTDLKNIANQIIDRIKITVKPEQTSMELQLNPEHLGKVNLTVQSKNGLLTAQFVVQNEVSKEAIESQLNILKDTLNEQGIKVEAIEVTVAGYNFEQKNQADTNNQMKEQKGQSRKKLTIEESMSIDDGPVEEITDDLAGIIGGGIDYSA